MIELKGKYNKNCKIFINDVESEALTLIQKILDQQVSEGVPVRIMPDVHAGKGIVIGFTMPLTKTISPNYVGVDIGCGMTSFKLISKNQKLNLEKINNEIRENIPMGFNIHETSKFKNIPFEEVQKIADLFTKNYNKKFGTTYISPIYNEKWLDTKLKNIKINPNKFWNAIGTLGGGNHFIEIGLSKKTNEHWITIHSGSRNFGLKIANYWTNIAKGKVNVASTDYNEKLNDIVLNTEPKSEIPKKIKELKENHNLGINKEFLQGSDMMGYLYDMIFAQQYAHWNRLVMMYIIKNILNVHDIKNPIHTIHNYVDFNDFIIRKGAISSYKDQKIIIPFNMRDGILICEGKSNSDWNFSAPHGAGRLMSRTEAKSKIDLKKFKNSMSGIYSTSVNKNTLDESPFAYKSSKVIENAIHSTATIIDKIKPVLNIKDGGSNETWKERRKKKKINII